MSTEWKVGDHINHNGITTIIERIERDEWLGEPLFVLYCTENRLIIPTERTMLLPVNNRPAEFDGRRS